MRVSLESVGALLAASSLASQLTTVSLDYSSGRVSWNDCRCADASSQLAESLMVIITY